MLYVHNMYILNENNPTILLFVRKINYLCCKKNCRSDGTKFNNIEGKYVNEVSELR